MFVKDVENNDKYFIDLYSEMWHYILLGFIWFIPHRAYRVSRRKDVDKEKSTIRKSVGIGVAIGLGTIFADYYLQIESSILPYSIVSILKIFIIPLIFLAFYLMEQYFVRSRKNSKIDREDFIKIKVNVFSLNTLKNSLWRIILAFYFIYLLFQVLRLKITLIIMFVPSLIFMIIMLFNSIGYYLIFDTENGRKFVIDIS